MLIYLLSFLLLITPVFAKKTKPPVVKENCDTEGAVVNHSKNVTAVMQKLNLCPNYENLKSLCALVGEQSEDPDSNSPNLYLYQTKVFEGACVNIEKDNKEVVKKKIQALWAKFEDKLICDSPLFNSPQGSVIKYAVSRKFEPFLEDVVQWGVNLNRIDPIDQQTVLDYVKNEMVRVKGTSMEVKMKAYYQILRNGGAKHKAEL